MLALLFALLPLCLGQFGPSKQLSFGPGVSMTENMMQDIVQVGGSRLLVVWSEGASSSPTHVYLASSPDLGTTWSNPVLLSPADMSDSFPYIAACGDVVHLVYWRNAYNTMNGILPPSQSLYRRSLDGGSTWLNESVVANNFTYWPGVACSGSYVYVNLNNHVTPTNTEIFLVISADNGATFGAMKNISNANGRSEDPAMAAYGSSLYLAWNDNRLDLINLQLYYRRSTDNGASWGPETAISALPQVCYSPTVAVDGSSVILMMMNHTAGSSNAFLCQFTSTDSGTTFSGATLVQSQYSGSGYPLVVISGNNVHVTFGIIGSKERHSYYVKSTDMGKTWPAPQILATWPSDVNGITGPTFIALTGETVHVAWRMLNASGGVNQMFYAKNATGNSAGNITVSSSFTDKSRSDSTSASSFTDKFSSDTLSSSSFTDKSSSVRSQHDSDSHHSTASALATASCTLFLLVSVWVTLL